MRAGNPLVGIEACASSPSMRLLQALDTNDTRSEACDIPSKHEERMLSGGGRTAGDLRCGFR